MPTTTGVIPPVAFRPIYDPKRSYYENLTEGPFFTESYPERPQKRTPIEILGRTVLSPLGVPAGPLLNSRWIAFAARMGFDILTYKTIRSHRHAGHPLPNVLFVEAQGDLIDPKNSARALDVIPKEVEEIAITNSFGNPSMTPEYLGEDIAKSLEALGPEQMLIVSVFGTGDTLEALKKDYAATARFAQESGAHAVEANFSCPNVKCKGGSLYADLDAAHAIAQGIVAAAAPAPVIIKLGYIPDSAQLKGVLTTLARAGVAGVCGINTLSMRVVDREGHPALGDDRPTSGVCGAPIRPYALDFTAQARKVIDAEKLGLTLMTCGGATAPEHFDEFLNRGAEVAMAASGMMWDPYLALRWHDER